MSHFTYHNKQIYYEETGSGTPLILLHGNTSCGKMFDQMKSGRLYVTKIESNKLRGSITSYLLALDIYENKKFEKIVIRIPMSVIKRATARAQRNPEDIATVGWFHDLLD